jgi:hypothetical protein
MSASRRQTEVRTCVGKSTIPVRHSGRPWWRTHRSQVPAWPVSWIAACGSTAGRRPSCPTTARNWPAGRSWNGRTGPVSPGTTSRRASRSRTGSWSCSTASCAMNASAKRSSTTSLMPARCWRAGATTTTTTGPTHHWAGSRPQRAGRSSYAGAALPARSPVRNPWTMKGSDSRNKRGTGGSQVNSSIANSREQAT